MLRTKNFGRKSLNEIKEILGSLGLGFGMKFDSQGRLIAPSGTPALLGVADVEVEDEAEEQENEAPLAD